MNPNFFNYFFAYEYPKYAEFYANFETRENNWKKSAPIKVIYQTFLKFLSIEEDKLQFYTLLSPIAFLFSNFSHFS
jgi:hypothetical protein